jgi:hypothetical protein
MRESFSTSRAGSGVTFVEASDVAGGGVVAVTVLGGGVLGGGVLGGGVLGAGAVAETDGEVDGGPTDDGGVGDGDRFDAVVPEAAGAFLCAGSPRLSSVMVTATATIAIAINDVISTASRLVPRARRCVPGGRSGSVIDVAAGCLVAA